MAAHGLRKSIHSPCGAASGLLGPGATGQGMLRGVLLAAAALGGAWIAVSSTASSATLDLNGVNVTLPDGTVFTTPFLTGSNNVTNNGATAATLIEGGGPTDEPYSGVISDGTSPTAWTHTGGDIILLGANTYSGATTIEAGGLVIAGAANVFSAASATTVNAGGTLDLAGFVGNQSQTVSSLAGAGFVTNAGVAASTLTNQGASSTFSGVISDGGGFGPALNLVQNSPGNTLTLSGANTYTGATTVAAGTLRGGASNAFSAASPTTVSAGGTLDLGGFDQTVSALAGGGTATNSGSSAHTLTNQGASSTFSGVIRDGVVGSTSLTQNSAGNILTLSGANTYTGATTINAGTLALSGAGSIKNSTSVQIAPGPGAPAPGGTFDISQTTTGASIGFLVDMPPPDLSTFPPAPQAPGEKVSLGSKTLTIMSGDVFTAIFSGVIQDGGIGGGAGGNLKITGTQTLSGQNTYTGETTIDGELVVTENDAIARSSDVVLANGVFDISFSGATIRSLSGSGEVDFGGSVLTVTNQIPTESFTGTFKEQGIFCQVGCIGGFLFQSSFTLFGQQTYQGGTMIEAGTLTAAHADPATGVIDALGVGQITLNGLAGLGVPALASSVTGTLATGAIVPGVPNAYNNDIAINGSARIEATPNVSFTLADGFTYSGGLNTTLHFGSPVDTGTVVLAFPAAPTVTTGGQISVDGGTVQLGNSNAQALLADASNVSVTGAGTLNLNFLHDPTTVQNLTLAGGTLENGALIGPIVSSGGTLNEISGTASLTTTSGTTTLIGTSYTGPTTIAGGILQIENGTTIAPGNITDNGTLAFNRTDTFTFANPVSGTGGLAQIGTGTTILTGDNLYTGGMKVSAGTLELSGTGRLGADSGSTAVSGGVLDLGGTTQTQSGGTTLSGGGTIENGNLNSAISSSGGTLNGIGGAASLMTTGGTTTLLGNETYTGPTTVNGGALEVLGALGTSLAPSGAITIASRGTLDVDLSGSINIGRSSFANSGTLNNNGNITAGGLTNNGTLRTTGTINGGLTNTGAAFASGTINGGIQNFSAFNPNTPLTPGGFALLGNLKTDGVFNNSGTVRVDPSQTNVMLTAKNFVNNGVLDLTNPHTVATNFTIQGNYAAEDPQINLNVFAVAGNTGQQANHLTITGAASGATNVLVTPFQNILTIFPKGIPIISVGPGSTATFSALQSPIALGSIVGFGIQQDPANPQQWEVTSKINPVPIGSIAGSISSAVTSVATGFFQGSTAFLSAPATATPNQIDGGVWTRVAAGMNTERSVATTSEVSGASDLKTRTYFSGYQVGSDLGMFNIQNTGWNLHGGITGGEYVASTGELNFGDGSSSYTVPFLGLYAAATGHGFFADVLVRHDFWQGDVTSAGAAITNARMDGNANAVTAEAGYTYRFQNGIFNGVFVTPSVGFAYTNANFQQLNTLPGSLFPPTLNVGEVVSELGRLGATLGETFATTYWALTPNLNVSVWHEFAGAIPSVFTSAQPGQPIFTDNVSETRIGTFGQIGVGLTAQPIQNPNWTLFARADWRTGSNLYGGTISAGFRYQF